MSSLTKVPNSSGELPSGSKPKSAMRFRTSASFMAVMKSVCSFSMMGRGVPPVARTPFQPKTLKPGRPDSATVGRSGAKAERLAVETRSRSAARFVSASRLMRSRLRREPVRGGGSDVLTAFKPRRPLREGERGSALGKRPSMQNQSTNREKPARGVGSLVGLLYKPWQVLFGFDFFISYSRKDGTTYALELA